MPQLSNRKKRGYILDRSPVHHRVYIKRQTATHANIDTSGLFRITSPNLTSIPLDCGRMPQYPEKSHQAQGEDANS